MTIKLFGILAEIAGADSMEIDVVDDTQSLRKQVLETIPGFKSQPFSIAVNQCLHHENTALHPGDELALLPPFSGG